MDFFAERNGPPALIEARIAAQLNSALFTDFVMDISIASGLYLGGDCEKNTVRDACRTLRRVRL